MFLLIITNKIIAYFFIKALFNFLKDIFDINFKNQNIIVSSNIFFINKIYLKKSYFSEFYFTRKLKISCNYWSLFSKKLTDI